MCVCRSNFVLIGYMCKDAIILPAWFTFSLVRLFAVMFKVSLVADVLSVIDYCFVYLKLGNNQRATESKKVILCIMKKLDKSYSDSCGNPSSPSS